MQQESTPKTVSGSRRLLATAAMGALFSGLMFAAQDGEGLDDTRSALEQYVENRRLISQEKQRWELGRQTLDNRIDLVGRQIVSLREEIATAQGEIDEADQKRADLFAENEQLKQTSSVLLETVQGLEERTKGLLARLPDEFRDRVKPLSQRLPEDPASTKLSLGGRFENVVGILNEINKFNREITTATGRRELGDGSTAEVTMLYVGIAQGYYVTAGADAAGVGRATEDGWVWSPDNAAAANIQRAIDIFEGGAVASYVQLPVSVD